MNKIPYSEKGACIDLILDSYKGLNPFEIVQKAKEDLDIVITTSEVFDYLQVEEDLESESRKVQLNIDSYE